LIAPRYRWEPLSARTLGKDAVDWWESHGGRLDEWQKFALEGILGVDSEGKWVATESGMNVARQNGKGVVLQVVEGFCAFELHYPVVMHTAHEFATSQEHQIRLEYFIQNAPALHRRVKTRGGYVHANGQESIRLTDGSRIIFKARTKGGGRGYSGDLLVWDEAMVLPDAVVGAQMPMMRASSVPQGPKIIYAGSAVDQQVHPYGIQFARIRERGIQEKPGVSWHEWSLPYDDPNELSGDIVSDRTLWPLANPGIEAGRIHEDHMAQEIDSMAARTAAVELLGVGDWPATDGSDDYVIHIDAWDACKNPASQLQTPFVLAYDVSPERRSSIVACGRNQDGKFHTEVHEHRPGTDWVVPRLIEMYDTGLVSYVVCDGVGPSASLLQALRDVGLPVETINTNEHGQMCGRLVDMVVQAELAHLGSDELRDAIRGARSRPLGDAWAWSRKNSSVDISPLVAATLGLGAAAGIGQSVQVF
jgi:hypothetical protein